MKRDGNHGYKAQGTRHKVQGTINVQDLRAKEIKQEIEANIKSSTDFQVYASLAYGV